MKTLVETTLLLCCQVLTALVVYEGGWVVGSQLVGPIRNDLSWGITLYTAQWVYIGGALLLSLLLTFSKQVRQGIVWLVLVYSLFLLFFIQTYQSVPYRTVLLLTSALSGMLVAFFIRIWRIRRLT